MRRTGAPRFRDRDQSALAFVNAVVPHAPGGDYSVTRSRTPKSKGRRCRDFACGSTPVVVAAAIGCVEKTATSRRRDVVRGASVVVVVSGAVVAVVPVEVAAVVVAAGSKNSPLTTAFIPPVRVMRNCTCPLTFQDMYTPLSNGASGERVSRTTPSEARTTSIFCRRSI